MKRQLIAAVFAIFSATCLAGCAFQEDVVSIPYKAQGGPQLSNAAEVAVAVDDARTTDRTRISNKKNGYGMEMAAIRADKPVPDIIKDAFEAELKSRGFRIGPGGSAITVSVTRFYSTFKSGILSGDAVADVQLHVLVLGSKGASLFDKEIDVEGKEADIQLASGSNAAKALADGIGRALDTLFQDPAFVEAAKGQATSVRDKINS